MNIERGYAQHVGSRQEQQDAGLVLTDDVRGEQLVVVADGMGGHAGGSIASAQVAETARRVWAEHKRAPLEPKRLLERIIREGHEAINKAGAEKGLTPRSTCALLLIRDGTAYWAHVGDSRVYRLRGGQLARLTRDHSVVQMLVDLGKVSEEEMGTHPDQNRLTQSLGGETVPMPDFGNDAIRPHDAFLVCSDGLWEMIPPPEMAAILAARRLGDDGARHLAERAFDRAKPKSDNITVALVRLGGAPPGEAAHFDEAPTTRIPDAARRRAGAGARWGFLAAMVVALGAAAAVVYQPWEPSRGTDAQPAAVPPRPPDAATSPPPQPAPKKPESEGQPERQDAQPPSAPPREPGTPQQGTPPQPAPPQSTPEQGTPQQGAPPPGERGNNEKERPKPEPGGAKAKPGSGSDAPPKPPDPVPDTQPQKPPTPQ